MNPAQRSAHMAKIKSKNTKPELLLRKKLHALGFRYRLHDAKLPGRPDLVFPSRKKVVFVNGCFWHGHHCPVGTRLPKSNTAFWIDKRKRNQARDQRQISMLNELGWECLVVWECTIKAASGVPDEVIRYLQAAPLHPTRPDVGTCNHKPTELPPYGADHLPKKEP